MIDAADCVTLLGRLDQAREPHGIRVPDSGNVPVNWPVDTLLAATILGEAENQGDVGMLLVACVIRRRVQLAPRYGADLRRVLTKRWAFSLWNPGNSAGIRATYPLRHAGPRIWNRACEIASDVIAGRIVGDPACGATHYHNQKVTAPQWNGEGMPPLPKGWGDPASWKFCGSHLDHWLYAEMRGA